MRDIEASLRRELVDREYAEGYAESLMGSHLATQIRVLREQRGFSKEDLAKITGLSVRTVSRMEDVNNPTWNVRSLVLLARAFDVRLKISFETYGSLAVQAARFTRKNLERVSRANDPGLRHPDQVWQSDLKSDLYADLMGESQPDELTTLEKQMFSVNEDVLAVATSALHPRNLGGSVADEA